MIFEMAGGGEAFCAVVDSTLEGFFPGVDTDVGFHVALVPK